jgi:hypothetical protein
LGDEEVDERAEEIAGTELKDHGMMGSKGALTLVGLDGWNAWTAAACCRYRQAALLP